MQTRIPMIAMAALLAATNPQAACGQIKSLFDKISSDKLGELPQSIDFDSQADVELKSQHVVRTLGNLPSPQMEIQLPITDSLETLRSKSVFRSLYDYGLTQSDSNLVVSFSNAEFSYANSPALVARWRGTVELTLSQRTKVLLQDSAAIFQHVSRPAETHIDLVWTGSSFELRQFHIVPVHRCQINPILRQAEAIELYIMESSDSLLLIPKDNYEYWGLRIVISSDGIARINNLQAATAEHFPRQ